MLSNNIDVNDARYNTTAPFKCNGEPVICGIMFTYDMFLSLRLKCAIGVSQPIYMSRISSDNETVSIYFADADGTTVGICQLAEDVTKEYKATLIFESSTRMWPVGHLVYRSDLVGRILEAFTLAGVQYVDLGSVFELLPECVGIRYPRSVVTADVAEVPGDRVGITLSNGLAAHVSDESIRIDAVNEGSISVPSVKKGIERVIIQHYKPDGTPFPELVEVPDKWRFPVEYYSNIKYILVESYADSDIRVTTSSSVNIRGAKNAK